ncbi:MAG TPA: hypothetical protein VJW17_02475 [Pyrinomonadaceae bacterium]|nr:hypothetical protein [Pyrinomonadaceae bacterium]
MANDLSADIPVGDIQLYDNYVPALAAGNWYINVNQTLQQGQTTINTDPLAAVQEVVVSAPQFALDTNEIISQYPPQGSSGRYGEVLPNIVLGEPLLPWEREMNAPAEQPWLALMVFIDAELIGGDENSTTHSISTDIKTFLTPDSTGKTLKPNITKEDDVADTDPCSYILIAPATFQANAPLLSELRYLAHCRQINTGDKAIDGLNEHGLFSVVVANRFPATPDQGASVALKNIVHLVSLEGWESYLTVSPNFGNAQQLALLSLASWTFQCLPNNAEDFKGLMVNMLYQADGKTQQPPSYFWLRVPVPDLSGVSQPPAEFSKRLTDGFIPLQYHTRTGEDTFAWYRGPLTPLFTTTLKKQDPFFTADSAIIYQPAFGVFDFSLAGGWNIGRAAALSDKSFGKALLDFRSGAHALTDQLLQRLQSDAFTQSQIDSLDTDTTVQDEFLKALNTQLLADVGAPPVQNPDTAPPQANPPDTDPQTAVENFMSDPAVQQKVLNLVQDDLDPVSQWLAKLLLLYPVPFSYLVPDERMLPAESIRFFYMDNNWLNAMLDGALSIGMESSRETFFYEMTRGMMQKAAYEAAQTMRTAMPGAEPPPAESDQYLMSGLLLRSAVVSGWPNLAVRPYLNNQQLLKILRMDHLSPNVLLCIFWGVPDYVEISEPQEGFAFGVDDDGNIPLRWPITPPSTSGLKIGDQFTGDPQYSIRDLSGQKKLFMRTPASRVLDLNPDSSTALVMSMKGALEQQTKTTLSSFGPADLALQMVKAPEAVKLNSQS